MMKIGVDARPLSYQLTGIGYFLKYLLDEIQKIDQQNTYYLISNTRLEYELSNQRWHKVEGKLRGKLLSSVWMQTNVPYCQFMTSSIGFIQILWRFPI